MSRATTRTHRYHIILVISAIVFLVAGSLYRKTLLDRARKASSEIENVNAALLSEVQQLRQAFEKTEQDGLQNKINRVLRKPMPELVAVAPVAAPRAAIDIYSDGVATIVSPVQKSPEIVGGILLNGDGLVLSANYSAGKQALIVFENGNRSPAELIGRNPEAGLALLQVREGLLPVQSSSPVMASPPELQPGDPVLVIGRDERGEQTFALGRMSFRRGPTIRLDTVCSPEQDGAAVVSLQGNLIGIQLRVPGTNQCSCLHMEAARAISQRILRQSKQPPPVGFELQDLNDELKQYYKAEKGLLVVSVEEGTPASQSGLLAGDLIRQANGQDVTSAADLFDLLKSLEEGTILQLRVQRGKMEKTVELQPLPPSPNPFGAAFVSSAGGGVMLRSVVEGSPAYRAGLADGDVIVAVDEQAIRDRKDFLRRLQKKNGADRQLWRIRRQIREFYVAVKLADLS